MEISGDDLRIVIMTFKLVRDVIGLSDERKELFERLKAEYYGGRAETNPGPSSQPSPSEPFRINGKKQGSDPGPGDEPGSWRYR